MSTIKQLIQLHLAGVSNRQIAKQLGIYKNTVNKYIRTLSLDPLSCQDLLTLDDPVLERRLHAGSPAYCQDRTKTANCTENRASTGMGNDAAADDRADRSVDVRGAANRIVRICQANEGAGAVFSGQSDDGRTNN